MIALWCPTFGNHGWLSHPWNTTAYFRYYFHYLLSLLWKGSCMNIFQIYRTATTTCGFYVSYKELFSCLSVEQSSSAHSITNHAINWPSPKNDATSLTMHTTYMWHEHINKYIYIYELSLIIIIIYKLNSKESNHRDVPAGDKNIISC